MIFTQYHDRGWGLLHTRHRSEKMVCNYMEQHGVPCYLPLVKRVRSKYRTVYEPMYGGYLFAAWKWEDRTTIKYCSNICNYVEVPVGCDAEIIEQMESLYKIEQLSETRDVNLQNILQLPQKKFQTINSGVLKGFCGYWKEINGKKTFAIIMNVLDSRFEATIDGDGLIFA